jgi:hypothetical protein
MRLYDGSLLVMELVMCVTKLLLQSSGRDKILFLKIVKIKKQTAIRAE